jgi:hypothetical protein
VSSVQRERCGRDKVPDLISDPPFQVIRPMEKTIRGADVEE